MRNSQRTQELARKAQEQAVETRQAQLLMNLYETYSSLNFRRQLNTIWYLEWTDYDETDWREGLAEFTTYEVMSDD